MFVRVLLGLLLMTVNALAEQPDAAFLQKAIGAVQTQRNLALDAAAAAEAKVSIISDDLAKAQARIKELEAKKPSIDEKPERP